MKLLSAVVAACVCSAGLAQVRPVTLDHQGDGWRLLRDGKPYFVKGGGGITSLELLAESGGNSFRLWGADDAGRHLDAAQKLGLTVTVGIWLGHERHGFSYNNAEDIAKLLREAREAATKFKDHPALLVWGVGNEMEAEKPDNAAIWLAVNAVAAEIKKIDRNHPTMVVLAEIGTTKLKHIEDLCPDIDMVGVNAYGGAATLPQRYRELGGSKPYLLTEYGPGGHWESPKADWGASLEPTSTEKARVYADVYRKAVLGAPGLCLGSYAFIWGHKQEATVTWFGTILPDGTRLAAVDELRPLWSGVATPNRCPTIASLSLGEDPHVKPGDTLHAKLEAADPEGDPLKVTWVLTEEQARYASGGDATPALREFPAAILQPTTGGVTIKVPDEPIAYRLYAYVRDGKGGGATANIPFTAGSPKPKPIAPAGPASKLPVTVYADDLKNPPYASSGWMGSTAAMKLDPACKESPRSGATCLRFEFTDTGGWGAIAWQSPAGDWGDKPGGLNLTGATKLTLWARGSKGGEKVDFKVGLIDRDKAHPDSAKAVTSATLTPAWAPYTIDLTGKDLASIKTGFVIAVAGQGRPLVVDLDDIRFE